MEQLLPLLLAALTALGIMLIFLSMSSRSDVAARLERYASTAASNEIDENERQNLAELIQHSAAMASLSRVVERRDWATNMAADLARADLALKPSEWLLIRLGAMVGLPVIVFLLGSLITSLNNPVVWLIALFVGFMGPRVWLGRRKSTRLRAFNNQLADTITLLANSLRAGSSFLQSLDLVVRESHPPISTEFQRVIREINLGLTLEQALGNMNRRVRSEDLDLLTTAIIIQTQVGGNLAEILDSIAFTIRERVRIKGEIRTLTAQGRMSGWVVGGLPVFLAGIIWLVAPTFMEPMFVAPPDIAGIPLGMIMLGMGGVSMAIGFAFIRRIVNIEV